MDVSNNDRLIPYWLHLNSFESNNTWSYRDVSILVWSNFDCIDETFGRAGLIAKTTCFSPRAIGTVLLELTDNAIDVWLPVGEVGVPGIDSSRKKKMIPCNAKNNKCGVSKSKPAEVLAIASPYVADCRWPVGTQNVSLTDTGLRFDDRKLVESIVSTLYGILPPATKSASWL